MPLAKATLESALAAIPLQDSASTAGQAWFDAWWKYAQLATSLIPGGGGRSKVESAFVATMTAACQGVESKTAFFDALKKAMAAAWQTLGTPADLLTPGASITPATGPFVVSPKPEQNQPTPSGSYADTVHTWTITHMVPQTPPPTVPPIPLA